MQHRGISAVFSCQSTPEQPGTPGKIQTESNPNLYNTNVLFIPLFLVLFDVECSGFSRYGFSPASLKMLAQMPKILFLNPSQFLSRKW